MYARVTRQANDGSYPEVWQAPWFVNFTKDYANLPTLIRHAVPKVGTYRVEVFGPEGECRPPVQVAYVENGKRSGAA